MKLPRIDQDTRKPSVLEQVRTPLAAQNSQQTEQQPAETEDYRSELDKMSDKLVLMSQESLADWDTRYRLNVIVQTVREQNAVLENLLKDIKEEMEKINSNQLQLLSTQEQYAKSVRDEVTKSVKEIYSLFRDEQKKAFVGVADDLKTTMTNLKTEIGKSVTTCRDEAEDLRNAFRVSRTLSTGIDLFYFLAPASIIGYVIFKLVAFFT